MPTFDEYLAMLQPNQEQARKQAMWQALSGLGAGLLGGRNWQQGLSRGGLLAYDAMQGSQDRAAQDAMVALKQRMMAQELADKDSAKEQAAKDQQQLGSIFSGGPNLAAMGPGGPTPANAAAVKPPSQVEQYRKAAAFYAARGNVEGAKKLADIADAIEGTYSTSPQVSIGPDGKPVYAQFSNKGGYRAAEGIAPPPDMTLVDTGGAKTFVDKLTTKPGTSFAMTMDPAQKDASARGWAGLGLEREKFGYQQGKDAADRQAASVTGGKPSDAQLLSRGFLERMQASNEIIGKLEDSGYTPGVGEGIAQGVGELPVVGGALGPIARGVGAVVTPQQPLYRQAQMDWVRAKLRKESGAVIGPKEMEDEIKTYFPQPGDSKAVIKQKAESRRAAERAMSISAGLTNYTGKADAQKSGGGWSITEVK